MNSDKILRTEMNWQNESFNASDYLQRITEWETKTKSLCYAILLDNSVIGQISLSHIEESEGKARTGYWITSNQRGKGFATRAFLLILGIAKGKGLKYLQSTILKNNTASLKIWEKLGAQITSDEERYYPSIAVNPR